MKNDWSKSLMIKTFDPVESIKKEFNENEKLNKK